MFYFMSWLVYYIGNGTINIGKSDVSHIKKSCKPISFHLRTPCCDRRYPAAIVAILPRSCCDNRNT